MKPPSEAASLRLNAASQQHDQSRISQRLNELDRVHDSGNSASADMPLLKVAYGASEVLARLIS
jgi:hypothetical protein